MSGLCRICCGRLCETANVVWRWLLTYDVCSMTDIGMQKVLKEFETAVRRTGRWYDWTRMDVEEMGKIVNANLFVGRGRFAVDWGPEYNNRCDEEYKLLYYDRDSGDTKIMLEKLRLVLIQHLKPLILNAGLLKYTWNMFCADANSWVASGSMCGSRIEYEDSARNPLNANAGKRTL